MKKLKISSNYYRTFVLGSVGAVLLLAMAFVAVPELDNDSFAVTCTSGTTADGDICDTDSTVVNVSIDEILNIASVTINGTKYDGDAELPETAFGDADANGIQKAAITVTADTNVAAGYQMQLEGVKTVDAATDASDSDLVRNESPYITISTFKDSDSTADKTPATFKAGRWGYMLSGDSAYKAIPDDATTVATYYWAQKDGAYTINKDTAFTFGVKPATNQTAGTYEGSVRFTVISNTGSGS